MKNFKQRDDKRGGFGGDRGGRDGDKPKFYGKSRGGDRSTDREQKMFKAVCSDCHKSCDVPFKPSSDKPVFCRDCFSAKRDRETREYKAGLANGEPKKFGQDKPASYVSPVYSSSVLPKVDESMKKQFTEMSIRLDKLTVLVEKMLEDKKVVAVPTTVSKLLVAKPKKVSSPTKKVIVIKKATPKKVSVKKVNNLRPSRVSRHELASSSADSKAVAKKTVTKKDIAKKMK